MRRARRSIARWLRSLSTTALVISPILAVGAAWLLGFPAICGGLGWNAVFGSVPDLSLTVLTIGGLAVATGLVRLNDSFDPAAGRLPSSTSGHHATDVSPHQTPHPIP